MGMVENAQRMIKEDKKKREHCGIPREGWYKETEKAIMEVQRKLGVYSARGIE